MKYLNTLLEWVPVSQGLPSLELDLVVYRTERDIYGLAQHFPGDGWWDPREGKIEDVVAWYAFPYKEPRKREGQIDLFEDRK